MGPLTVAPWGKWCGGFGWSGLNEARPWRWVQESCSLAGTRFNVLTEPDVFFPSTAVRVFSSTAFLPLARFLSPFRGCQSVLVT